jgi:hypothetical protein
MREIRLFSTGERTRTGGSRYNESSYSFLDTSGWPSVERVRDFWEGWFCWYADDRKAALAGRFQAHDDHTHLSAFLELFTFAALKQVGFEVEVEVPVGSLAVDFRATKPTGPTFYAECTATGRRAAQASGDRREADVLQLIDEMPTGRFLLQVEFQGRGCDSPAVRRLRPALLEWLSSLQFDAMADQFKRTHEIPQWTWRDRGWTVEFGALPAELPPASTDDERAVGIVGPRVLTNDQHIRLREAIDWKASKYGRIGNPLLVVTDSTEFQTDRDVTTALFGDVVWHIDHASKTFHKGRKPNGVFCDAKGPRNLACSAVMHGHSDALNFTAADRTFTLTHHPFAVHALTRGLFAFCEERYSAAVTGDKVTIARATTVAQFFGLPEGWPHFDQDPV